MVYNVEMRFYGIGEILNIQYVILQMQKSDYYLKDFVSSFFEFIIIYCFKQTK